MPTFRDVFRYLFGGHAALEDFADRLNHVWTVGLLLVLSCIISWKQGYSKPMVCWCPAHLTDNMVEYVNDKCWNSYIIVYPRDLELNYVGTNESDPYPRYKDLMQWPAVSQYPLSDDAPDLVKRSSTATVYQWLPLILCFQALLFKLPCILMYVLHRYTGINFDKIGGLTSGYSRLNLQERRLLGRQISRLLYPWCRQCDFLPWRFLTLLWFCVKIMYCVNIIVQMCLLDAYLTTSDPPYDNSTSFGDAILANVFDNNATTLKESPVFPRSVMCDFSIRQLNNIHRYTVQCSLPANVFNEHAYMFLWVWLLVVTLVTCLSLVIWMIRTLVPIGRKRYITKFLECTDDADMTGMSPSDVSRLCDVVGEDGIMVLKLVTANSSELLTQEIVCNMWRLNHRKPDESRPPLDATAPVCAPSGYASSIDEKAQPMYPELKIE